MYKVSLSEKVFQGPKVAVNRFGWNLAQKLGMRRYFKSNFGSLLWLFKFWSSRGISFFALWVPKIQPSRGHFESAIKPHWYIVLPNEFDHETAIWWNFQFMHVTLSSRYWTERSLGLTFGQNQCWNYNPNLPFFQISVYSPALLHNFCTVYFSHPIIKISWERLGLTGCKESQFYSLPFGQAVDSMY